MASVGYIRVSTTDQNTARQQETLSVYDLDKVFIDKVSAKTTNRKQLQAMLEYVREGDTVYVSSIDRLARNMSNLRELVDGFKSQSVTLVFVKEALTFTPDANNPMSELMLNLLGSFAAFERSLIRERQAEGIAAAKAKGVYKGRPATIDMDQFRAKVMAGDTPIVIQETLGLSKSSYYRLKATMY
jgi:DNA invertase Pin-like site-specific DNA recombinase